MKAIFFWIIAVFILVCFGVVGRIDYESELAMADMRIENLKWAAEVAASQVAK